MGGSFAWVVLKRIQKHLKFVPHAGLAGKKSPTGRLAYREVIFSRSPSEGQILGVFVERVAGVEPASSVWKTDIIAAIRHPRLFLY